MTPAEEPAIVEDLVEGSDRLFFFFGGIAGAIGMPPFEFYKATRILDCSKIFIRDISQSWYQRGLPGIGNDARAIGEFLSCKIAQAGNPKVHFVGNSMGGFGALLFCAMLRTGRATVFSPQTFVSQGKREKTGDHRWAKRIDAMHQSPAPGDIYELRPWITEQHSDLSADIYVSTADELDLQHAEELAGFPNIRIHRFPDAGHGLVSKLRNEGLLAGILKG